MTKNILPEDWLAKISRFQVATASKLRGQHKGSHRSQRFGASLDFSDFREYHLGDDVRQVDWNVFARTDKYFIKRFLDEQEMRVHILLDATKSMGEQVKWTFARQIVASLGLMVLGRDDRLSFSYVQDDVKPPFRRKGAMYRRAFLQVVTDIEEANYTASFSQGALKAIPKDSTVLFIVTDGLESIEEWEQLLKRLPRFAGDVRIIQVVTEEELHPQYAGDVRLVDSETGRDVNVTMSSKVLDTYDTRRRLHEEEFEAICRRFGVRKLQLKVEDGLQHAIFQQLLKAHWIR
ncbi:DUF58 domain-containing protein [Lysinibacillus sphaericus]|uniref:DUF58 domain-containing protein n=2 Tax=Lysinibacillus TaxID=400634 RepID=A0A2S0K4C6_LYSSH|nr:MULTISPECIES: DUF58 domain-containing protein [Lysinibacillus]AHN20719.1 hypothetical protein T479_04020 [Lysinibacillus varians]AVK98211.1 DUF58 domain-containing protein [Lysinibacillus sphaericus]MCS1383050.1 DUF58 domain-containing protein [Lysinibacillus sphaericus]MED4543717.1 DUF58 domain-containing protein [Lysinibacillus sphaericus]TKI19207.1 DUF58 domain-containing protein [Lysinibacillus sphaericus]